jgi:hypothetical protein
MLLEKKIQHELIVVDMAAHTNHDLTHLALNPYGRVPTIQNDLDQSCTPDIGDSRDDSAYRRSRNRTAQHQD